MVGLKPRPERKSELSAHPDPAGPAGQSRAIPAIGDLVNGKYRVDGTAGTGGMGVVLSATHLELGHHVAIKLLVHEEATDARAVERFLREAKAAASLQSDHVVRIHDVGRLDSGAPFMVMELLRGEDLGSFVRSHGPIAPSQAVDWILQACNAIAEAHATGIVHRDLKPANLFLTQRSDGSDCVKVLDFGISKRLSTAGVQAFQGDLTATRQVVGSPAYMSPEQVRNSREIDHRVDIWALGMTLYEFLSGRPAFCADTFPAVCAAIVADAPAPLDEIATIPKELSQVVLRCLAKDPNERFASVSELALALLPFAPSRPLSTARSQQWFAAKPEAPVPTSSTLASARSLGELQRSGPRGIETSERNWPSRTLLSDGNAAAPDSPARKHSLLVRVARKRTIWLVLGVVGFSVGVAWKLQRGPAPKQSSLVGAPVVRASSFAIRFESEPSGAAVWEGDRLLGTTPLDYALEHASVRIRSRTFSVRSEGYLPLTISQGDSDRDVVVMARLQPQRLEPDSAPAAASAAPRNVERSPGAVVTPTIKGNQPLTKARSTLPTDIRLQR